MNIDIEAQELPRGMPLSFVNELTDLNLEKLEYSLFLTEKALENCKKQKDVFYRAMKSMATRDAGFCFQMGQLNAMMDKEIEGHEEAKKMAENYVKRLLIVKEKINNV